LSEKILIDQVSLSRLAGLDEALQRWLIELSTMYGRDAKLGSARVRDELILKFENGVVSERTRVIEPAISVIESAFADFV
jgi:hypothetical protein